MLFRGGLLLALSVSEWGHMQEHRNVIPMRVHGRVARAKMWIRLVAVACVCLRVHLVPLVHDARCQYGATPMSEQSFFFELHVQCTYVVSFSF